MQPKEVMAEKRKQNKGNIHQSSCRSFRFHRQGVVAISGVAISVPARSTIPSYAPPPLIPSRLLLHFRPRPTSHVPPRVPTISCLPSLLSLVPLSPIS